MTPIPSIPDEESFLGRVGHDLRGELATMVAGVHYLMRYEGGISEPGKQMLDRVNGAGGRMRRLLDELEHAAWIGGRPPGPIGAEPCRLQALVAGALGRIAGSVEQRRVTLDVDVPPDLPAFEGDPELSGVALEYLLDFAVARSPDRAVKVRSVGPAALSVTDEGGPVDDATMERMFDPFVEKALIPRPEPGARRRDRLGLGLAIAHGIVGALGGEVSARVAPDARGLAFSVRLHA